MDEEDHLNHKNRGITSLFVGWYLFRLEIRGVNGTF